MPQEPIGERLRAGGPKLPAGHRPLDKEQKRRHGTEAMRGGEQRYVGRIDPDGTAAYTGGGPGRFHLSAQFLVSDATHIDQNDHRLERFGNERIERPGIRDLAQFSTSLPSEAPVESPFLRKGGSRRQTPMKLV